MKTIFAIMAAAWFAPIAGAQNSPAGQPAAAVVVSSQSDQPGTPLKPEAAGTPPQSEPAGTTLKPEPAGTPVNSEAPGTPTKSEAAGTTLKPEPAGTTIKPEPAGTPTKPEAAGTPAQPDLTGTPAQPGKKMTLYELRKRQRSAVAELKSKQADEIKTFRESLKGQPQPGIRKAMKIKKAEQNAALQALLDANKAEIAQFIKDHPKPVKQGEDTTNKQ